MNNTSIVHPRRWKRSVKTITTLHDEDCPACGWPETLIERLQPTMKPLRFRCPKCPWTQAIERRTEVQRAV